MKRVIEYFDGYYNPLNFKGIIANLGDRELFSTMFSAAGITDYTLADDYYINMRSGEKIVNAPMRRLLLNRYDDKITNAALKYIADVIAQNNYEKYLRLKEIIDAEYNPIENYDRYENLHREYSGDGTSTEDATNHDTGTSTNTGQIEGFNSATFKDSTKDTRQDNLTHTADIDRSHEDSGTEDNVNHIHGNIGVTTATAMMEEHKNFWDSFNILEIIYADIDNILTTNSY